MLFKKNKKTKIIKVGDYQLLANSEHILEDYLGLYKYYSGNLPRIAKLMERKYSTYSIIDIGANIGDTIALLRSANVQQFIYALDGDPAYFGLLQTNLSLFQKVKAYLHLLGDESKSEFLTIETNDGTGKVIASNKTTSIIRLDDFIDSNKIEDAKLIKIDTDGFDLKIIKGGLNYFLKAKPVLFFEYDAVFIEEQKDDGIDVFRQLQSIGYEQVLFYDNYGKLLVSTSVENTKLIKHLYDYMRKREGAFEYYDVCVFHSEDEELANTILTEEIKFFNS